MTKSQEAIEPFDDLRVESKTAGGEGADLWPVADGGAIPQAVKWVHAQLRRSIVSGSLPPGKIISQVRLAAELGVSRTPLREALRILEREGFVELEHNKRIRIARYSIEELEQVYAMRITLEALAARFSVPLLTDGELEFLTRAFEQMCLYAAKEDYDGWEEPHHAFHAQLLTRSGATLRRSLNQLSDHAERYRYAASTQAPFAWENGLKDHRAILDAARIRDAAAVAEAIARHYARVALNAVTLAAPEHDPRQIREALRAVIASNGRGFSG